VLETGGHSDQQFCSDTGEKMTDRTSTTSLVTDFVRNQSSKSYKIIAISMGEVQPELADSTWKAATAVALAKYSNINSVEFLCYGGGDEKHHPVLQSLELNWRTPASQLLQGLTETRYDLTENALSTYYQGVGLCCGAELKREQVLTDIAINIQSESRTMTIHFRDDLYRQDVIANFANHLLRAAIWLARNPQTPISELEFISTDERNTLLNEFNSRTGTYPVENRIEELFEKQVKRAPNKTAATFKEQSITYEELDIFSNKLANLIASIGVQPNSFVGIFDDRTIDYPGSILGIMKSGAAYVPIDPDYPGERIAYMIQDSQAEILITRSTQLDTLKKIGFPEQLRAVVCLDLNSSQDSVPQIFSRADIENQEHTKLSVQKTSNDLAYMIYTSGSTGNPKGAMNRHDGVLNHMYAEFDLCKFHENSAFLQSAPSSFDISVWQFLAPLVLGGKTVIVEREVVLDPELLLETLQKQQISVMELVPSVYKLLLEYLEGLPAKERALPYLDCAMVTGEAVPVEVVNKWFEFYPDIPMANLYGPTEASDDICQAILTEPVESNLISVSIGQPLKNLYIYILDENLNLQPLGVPGEICVSGIGVGAGYWQKPEKTAASFVENPFAHPGRGEVLYRTGDLGRWLPDGTIDFLGRLDNQVKVRGVRIELGEIEAAIKNHSSIKDAVVVAQARPNGEKDLVAYFIVEQNSPVDENQIRIHCKEQLPNALVPAAFMQLEAFPLTPNGKVDRKALPTLDFSNIPDVAITLPSTDTERKLAEIWGEVLQLPQIGIDQNFFEIGGTSLMVAQIVARIRAEFAVGISIRQFVEHATIQKIGLQIEAGDQQTDENKRDFRNLQHHEKSEYPQSFAQERLWFLHKLSPESSFYNMSYVATINGSLDIEILELSYQKLLDLHPILRTVYADSDSGPVQRILPATKSDFRQIGFEGGPGKSHAELSALFDEFAALPFDLTSGPLLRAQLISCGDDLSYFQIAVHHISCDGLSAGYLLYQLGQIYQQLENNSPVEISKPLHCYGDYALWQKNEVSKALYDQQLEYWLDQLADAPPLLELPTDFVRPAEASYQGDSFPIHLDEEVTANLRSMANRHGVTLFSVLYSALVIVMSRYSRSDDILIGSPISHRPFPELQSIPGMYINNIVLRSRLNSRMSVAELVQKSKENLFEALDHQDIPFERIVDAMHPQRSLSYNPVFQVFFGLEPVPDERFQLPGMEISVEEVFSPASRFDLSLFLLEDDHTIHGRLEFATDLFRSETVNNIIHHLHSTLIAIAENPEVLISEIELVSKDEKLSLTSTWQGQTLEKPRTTINDLFQKGCRVISIKAGNSILELRR
jgi:surfactin family lipopeptide synthetase A